MCTGWNTVVVLMNGENGKFENLYLILSDMNIPKKYIDFRSTILGIPQKLFWEK